jgi:hypothetical protein
MLPDLPGTDPSEYKYRLSEMQGILDPEWGITTNLQVTENGTKIKKTTPNGWNGSAASNLIISGKGYYQFTTDQTDAYIVTGLNDHPPAVTTGSTHLDVITDMEFAIGLRPVPDGTGNIAIWEDGVNVANFPNITYGIGWSFRIQKDNSTIKYLHDSGSSDWTVFYTSSNPAPLLLGPDVAIWNQNASYSNIKVYIEDGNLVAPGPSFVSASGLADSASINAHINNLNGPYQYPSWKQTRAGETPVVRYHKNSNILSISPNPQVNNPRPDTFTNFVEPPVTFRYKPLLTSLGADQPKIRSTYANNKGKFSLGINLTQSIQDFANIIDREDEQVYDTMLSVANLRSAITANRYSEVVYPREMLTGLAETRGRTNYSEVADGTEVLSGSQVVFISASLSIGSNGIDRGPLDRRTFWRDDPAFRNRRLNQYITIEDKSTSPYAYNPLHIPYVTGALPNSQGFRSGFATGINGFGETPIAFVTGASTQPSLQMNLSGADTLGLTLADYSDTGELNSANDQTIGGYVGSNLFSDPTGSGTTAPIDMCLYSVLRPTASCYYHHQQNFITPHITSSLGLKWRVAELSNKNPWFDSYEDYAQDIRTIAKNYAVLPEFRISKHMEHYVGQGFSSKNDQFLTLDGASITSSADVTSRDDGNRGFNESFFNEYSNSDFQKYFGKFGSTDDFGGKINRITLKCNAVKKLLPYYGFYPAHRSLQVASLFSQSIAPHIGGIEWKAGQTTNPSNTYPSGALAVQSLLQPFYAPGIMYNTVKSGIACDWGAYTGSVDETNNGLFSNAYLGSAPNYRIPFEAILNPLSDTGIPQSSSAGDQKINLLYPTYKAIFGTISPAPPVTTWAKAFGYRNPYFDLDDIERQKAFSSTKYSEYRLAVSNYMAEIPNFFLKGSSLKSIKSKRAGDVSLTSGKRYYMDVYLEKDPNLVMIEDYNNGHRGGTLTASTTDGRMVKHPLTSDTEYKSLNGRFFGPPVKAGQGSVSTTGTQFGLYSTQMGDPSYAPYTPPYFYGKSVATISYVADAADASGSFNFKKLFEKAEVVQSNPVMEGMFDILESGSPNAPALSGAMGLSSSMNLFGLFQEKQVRWDGQGNAELVVDAPDSQQTRWVISPKMETPVLDFSTQPEEEGWGRGMWSGYGTVPTGSGISFGVEQTYKNTTGIDASLTGSLIDACFETVDSQKIGELAESKEISEAIVAIPYIDRNINDLNSDSLPRTTEVMGRNFIKIEQEYFNRFKDQFDKIKQGTFEEYQNQVLARGGEVLQGESIPKMLSMMDKYIIPPELDFLTFNSGNDKVNPFVMYIFEFNHTLKKQDLSDIWQGVMPDISRIAETSDDSVDNNVFSHPIAEQEFFGGKDIPEGIRWMVFKVKTR